HENLAVRGEDSAEKVVHAHRQLAPQFIPADIPDIKSVYRSGILKRQEFSVRRQDGVAGHVRTWNRLLPQQAAGRRVPDAEGPIATEGDQAFAVRGEGQSRSPTVPEAYRSQPGNRPLRQRVAVAVGAGLFLFGACRLWLLYTGDG